MYAPPEVLIIRESPELFTDALLCDESGTFIFLSLWGHDTSMKEFIARLSLPVKDGGINSFHVGSDTRRDCLVALGNQNRLSKLTGKTTENTVFGGLSHMWLYDSLCEKPDFVNARALMLSFPHEDEKIKTNRLWQLVKKLCHLPLRDHWRDTIFWLLRESELVKAMSGIGIDGIQVHLDKEIMETRISAMIEHQILCLNELPPEVQANNTHKGAIKIYE